MDGDVDKAKRYREHAAEIRKIADGISDGNTQRILISIAAEYERLAMLLDGSDSPNFDVTGRDLAAFKKPP